MIDPVVGDYLAALQWHPDALLQEMHDKGRAAGIPIVSDDTGLLLDLLVRMHQPRHVVEFGTAIGYSTVFMARALASDALLTSFEIDPERHREATDNLSRAGVTATLQLQLGDALQLVHALTEQIEFAFLDATKGEYGAYLEAVLERMPEGGIVVVDNALMSGTVASGSSDGHWGQDSIDGQRAFNERFVNDSRLRAMVLPIGDGVGIGVRTGD